MDRLVAKQAGGQTDRQVHASQLAPLYRSDNPLPFRTPREYPIFPSSERRRSAPAMRVAKGSDDVAVRTPIGGSPFATLLSHAFRVTLAFQPFPRMAVASRGGTKRRNKTARGGRAHVAFCFIVSLDESFVSTTMRVRENKRKRVRSGRGSCASFVHICRRAMGFLRLSCRAHFARHSRPSRRENDIWVSRFNRVS